jgi:NAD(P)-dependent dehydrogenase (short-subunit alcohol dehydrogenase family)
MGNHCRSSERNRGGFDLDGEVAVVTGGAGGIGAAITRRLARAGATVTVADAANAAALADEVDGWAVATDIRDEFQVRNLMRSVHDKYGRLDILVNSAGAFHDLVQITEDSLSHYSDLYQINAVGALLAIKHAAPFMTNGKIVNIASTAAFTPFSGLGAYSASKAAMLSITRSAALELAPAGIRVNAVCPGSIDTSMARTGDTPDAIAEWTARSAPLRRCGRPEEIAAAVHFLVSDDCGWMTGSELVVDGGISLATVGGDHV